MTLCHIDLELDGGADRLQARIVGAVPAADVAGIMAVVTRAILAGQPPAAAPEVATVPPGPAPKPAPPVAPAVETKAPKSPTPTKAPKAASKWPGPSRGNRPRPDGRLTLYDYSKARGCSGTVYRHQELLRSIAVDGLLDPAEADRLLLHQVPASSVLGRAVRQALRAAGIDPGDETTAAAAPPSEPEVEIPAAAPEPIEPEPPAGEAAPGCVSPEGACETKAPLHPARETQAAPAPRPNGHGGPQPIGVVAQAAARWLSARGEMCKRPYPSINPSCWRVGKQEIDERALIEMARRKGAVLPEAAA